LDEIMEYYKLAETSLEAELLVGAAKNYSISWYTSEMHWQIYYNYPKMPIYDIPVWDMIHNIHFSGVFPAVAVSIL